MKKSIIGLFFIIIMLFNLGGCKAVSEAFDIIKHVFIGFFPILKTVIEQSFTDYISSPYFIVGVIIFFCSIIGIWLGFKQRKLLFSLVSIIANLFSLLSMISNLIVIKD